MKKFIYLLAVAAIVAACSGNKGYVVTGTVEGAADGDTVYLETVEGRQFVKLDSAVIKDGTFTFKGTQDTAVNRYISYKAEGKDGAAIDFFLENGKIKINLSQENNSATGTANNDAYQEIRAQINGLNTVSYTHLRAHETGRNLVCRLLLEKKKKKRSVFRIQKTNPDQNTHHKRNR